MLTRSTKDSRLIQHLGEADIRLGDRGELGCQLWSHIVWSREIAPAMKEAVELVAQAYEVLVVGRRSRSLQRRAWCLRP